MKKARAHIEQGKAQYAGLVATNSIRGGANRKVLERILNTVIPAQAGIQGGNLSIFEAWSDEEWINAGAAVRVSLVAFGNTELSAILDGQAVAAIHADLTAGGGLDLTQAKRLTENLGISFIGTQKNGPFDIPGELGRQWLSLPNPHNLPNADVVRPWANGMDITRRPSDTWVIDFNKLPEAQAALYEVPFAYVIEHVKPTRIHLRRDWHRTRWWLHGDPRPAMKNAIAKSSRFIISPRVSKHRLFARMSGIVVPDSATVAIACADDVTFGILHSRFHELWTLRMCTWLGVGNDPRYTPTTCFETFPFPEGCTPSSPALLPEGEGSSERGDSSGPSPDGRGWPTGRVRAEAIAIAAQRLDELRNIWLNPPEWVDWVITPEEEKAGYPKRPVAKPGFEAELKKRTLTNLYNQRPAWLDNIHKELDKAVANAYGWADYTPEMSDEEILKRLLVLNLQRAEAEKTAAAVSQ